MPADSAIASRLDAVRRRLTAAAHRVGRSPSDIQLVAVSKTFPADAVRAAASAGQRVFAENRVQEVVPKIEALADLDLDWHLVGHLQSNKARKAASAFQWIQSIDSADLVARVGAAASEAGRVVRVLVQVDLAHEATKHGATSDVVRRVVDAAIETSGVELRGLMLVPPAPEHAEDSRPWFQRLRALRDELVAGGVPADRLRDLSMGMSGDFEIAVEEGATIVRVGSAIFGER
jgi:pyridoxal phosphate enzyme (YggS family)